MYDAIAVNVCGALAVAVYEVKHRDEELVSVVLGVASQVRSLPPCTR